MRLLGIGPASTLVAAGILEERDVLILADFEDRTPESSYGTTVTELFRTDLSQSPVVRLMNASVITEALARMNRPPTDVIALDLATEIAQREGVKAVVAGEIGTLGSGYVISASLLSSEDGSVLVAQRETADDDSQLIGAVDRLSAKLRERIGESLRSIRASEPLERVTTSSLEALEIYTRAVRASDIGDFERALALLRDAVEHDSTFAMAYRKLAVVLSNAFSPPSQVNAAARRAFELRDRLLPVERYLAEAFYYDKVEYDRARVVAAYRSVLEIDPDETTALNNLALELNNQRLWVEAEELALRAIDVETAPTYFVNAVAAQIEQGKMDEATQTVALFEQRAPGQPFGELLSVFVAESQDEFAQVEVHLDAIEELTGGSPWWTNLTEWWRGALASMQGKIGSAESNARRHANIMLEQRGDTSGYLVAVAYAAWIQLVYRENPAEALRLLNDGLEEFPLTDLEPRDRPYSQVAQVYAAAGSVDEARRLLAEYDAAVPEAERRGDFERHMAEGMIAEAEGRLDDAARHYRARYEAGGENCVSCALSVLARVYEAAGEADSALAVHERAVSMRGVGWVFDQMFVQGPDLKRLGELYEERGNAERAVEFYDQFIELWQDADPELQPMVQEARARVAALVGERR